MHSKALLILIFSTRTHTRASMPAQLLCFLWISTENFADLIWSLGRHLKLQGCLNT